MKFNKVNNKGNNNFTLQDVNFGDNPGGKTSKESRLKTILQIIGIGIAVASLTVAIIANWDKLISFVHQLFT